MFRRKGRGNVYGIRILKHRKHKGKIFFPIQQARTKTELRNYCVKKKIHLENYYRIFKHKGKFTLYVGPKKLSHGGLRHKPTQKAYQNKMRKHPVHKPRKQNPERPTKTFTKVKRGFRKGEYRDEEGQFYTRNGYLSFRAINQNKYNFKVID